METRAIYTERKTFVKYDDNHYLLYLNEEVLENHVPEGHGANRNRSLARLTPIPARARMAARWSRLLPQVMTVSCPD